MKPFTFYFLLFLFSVSTIKAQEPGDLNFEEIRKAQLENISDTTLWDTGRMIEDIDTINPYRPMRFGAFPVPHYNKLMGKGYSGGAFQNGHFLPSVPDYRLQVKDKEIMFCSFFSRDGHFYQSESGKSEAFFTIITVSDTLTTENFVPGTAQFISRNHPDLVGQGSFLTKNDKVEFIAFTTPEKGSYAIVNMRLFHLEYGNVIIITPQKDGSFRSMQLQSRGISEEENYEYIKNELLKQQEVIDFLTADGVI